MSISNDFIELMYSASIPNKTAIYPSKFNESIVQGYINLYKY